MNKNEIDEINKRINEISDLRKRKLLNSIVKCDNWYHKVSLDTFTSVMIDLGYSIEEALNVFKKLNKRGQSNE